MNAFGITNRRHFMAHAAGAAAMAVPGMAFLSGLRTNAAELKKKNKSLIILWMGGGPTTIDLWDMKPDHPNGGSHKPKPTAASGVSISEHLPNLAKQFGKLSIVRSLTTKEGDHNRGTRLMSTGRQPNPLIEYPALGSVLSFQYGQDAEAAKAMDLPQFISVGNGPQIGPGFLGMKYASFGVANAGQPPENVSPPAGVSAERMARRKVMFDALEGGLKTNVPVDAVVAHKEVYKKAMDLVVSTRKDVFALDKEPTPLKEEYGNTGFGRGCLLARKLVEAGVACIEVNMGGWDNHQQIFPTLERRLPELDKGFAALTRDLADRGKLKDTVIVWMGEFGRTPRINQNGGRDHYPRAWSVVIGGGNIKGGMAYGSTSPGAEEPKDNPVKIEDLYSTIYAGLGLDPNSQIRDNLGRPTAIAGEKVNMIKDLLTELPPTKA
jgi:uncharacterized protein (DUF1501 family)